MSLLCCFFPFNCVGVILAILSVSDDFNRVVLSTSLEAEDSSDYINASYINVSKSLTLSVNAP